MSDGNYTMGDEPCAKPTVPTKEMEHCRKIEQNLIDAEQMASEIREAMGVLQQQIIDEYHRFIRGELMSSQEASASLNSLVDMQSQVAALGLKLAMVVVQVTSYARLKA